MLLRRDGGGVVLVPCSYKFLLVFFIRLCIYGIESFILSVSSELSLSQMLLRGVILGFLRKIWKVTVQNLLWANGYSKKLHGMLKNILKDIGYACFINIIKSRNTLNNILRKVGNLFWDCLRYAQEYIKGCRKSILESKKIIFFRIVINILVFKQGGRCLVRFD